MSHQNWFDLMEDDASRILRMSATEWKVEVKAIMRSWSGDLRGCLAYLENIESQRAAEVPQPVGVPVPRTEFQRDFALWQDMLEEPEKYGDDIVEWLELHETLMAGPGRWRLAAFALQHEERLAEMPRRAAATRIQAAVRGHQAREKMPFRDCAMCLAHTLCGHNTDVGAICRGCVEQGPYDDETGPLPDTWNWLRGGN